MERDTVKVDATIMNNFYKLVYNQPQIRLTAASSTFKILQAMKKQPKTAVKFNENLNYCISRLVSGLASNRAQARRGFGTLLLEIVTSFQVSTERLFTVAQKNFGHISKETTRDSLLAYLLLVAIVLKSENHKKNKANAQYLEKVYSCLKQLQYIKSYLEYSVCRLLADYYEPLHPYMVADLPQHAFGSDAKVTSFELFTLFLCNKKDPVRKLLSMDKSDLMNLCSILRSEKFQKRPLHPVFIEACLFFMTHFPQYFSNFYSEIIQPTFFKANHNELAAMGLELTLNLIKSADSPESIKVLLNEHLLRLLILSLRNSTSLKPHSVNFFQSLGELFSTEASSKDDNQFAVIDRLTSPPGSMTFDEDSRSSSLKDLLNHCNRNALSRYLEKLIAAAGSSNKEKVIAATKQIAHVIKRPQLIEDVDTIEKVAQFLLMNALLKTDLDESVKEAFTNAYHATLDQIVSTNTAQQRIEHLDDLIEFYERSSFKKSDLWSAYKKSLNEHKKLLKKNQTNRLFPITSLYLFYGLQVIEHELDCSNQLEELEQSATEVLEDNTDDTAWADILTDQILAILSATECKPWIRKLCEKVFGSLLSHISQTSIDLLCDALKTPLEGDSEDEDGDDDDGDDGDSDDSDDDDDSDGNEEDEEEVEMMSVGDDAMSAVDEEEEDRSLKENKVSSASTGSEDDNHISESDGIENDSDNEEYLDDDAMFRLDSVIADMFKTRRKKPADASFKLRCLDLVKIILSKKQLKNSNLDLNIVLATLKPLRASSKPIADKINAIIAKMPSKNIKPAAIDNK